MASTTLERYSLYADVFEFLYKIAHGGDAVISNFMDHFNVIKELGRGVQGRVYST